MVSDVSLSFKSLLELRPLSGVLSDTSFEEL